MNRVAVAACALLCCLSSNAAKNQLAVERANESVTYFELTRTPQITFSDSEMIVTAGEDKILFPLEDLKRYWFEESTTTRISSSHADREKVNISVSGRNLLSSANGVNIYSATGQQVLTSRNAAGTPVSLSALPGGVYVVTTGGSTFKIVLK